MKAWILERRFAMQKIVGVTELQRNFRAVFDEVAEGVFYVLTRGSRPEAALIPYDDFLRYQELKEKEVLAGFDRARKRLAELNAEYEIDEIVSDIEAALKDLE
jgi:prevent-host-death family protein